MKKMEKNVSEGENLVFDFISTRAAKQRTPAVYAHWRALTVGYKTGKWRNKWDSKYEKRENGPSRFPGGHIPTFGAPFLFENKQIIPAWRQLYSTSK